MIAAIISVTGAVFAVVSLALAISSYRDTMKTKDSIVDLAKKILGEDYEPQTKSGKTVIKIKKDA